MTLPPPEAYFVWRTVEREERSCAAGPVRLIRNKGSHGHPRLRPRLRPHEAALLALTKGGDRGAFQQLTECYRRELQVHCYRMLGSFHDAEDLVQETFLRAWRGVQGFDGLASMRHCCIASRRTRA